MNYVIFSILNYLVGSIPWALVIGKVFYKTDVREYGSGNLGATNLGRTLGRVPAVICAVLDALKGLIMLLIEMNIDYNAAIVTIIFVVIGHCYPIFAQFRGGKAVATSFGIILGLTLTSFKEFFFIFLLPLLIWLAIKMLTSLVSLASLVGILLSAVISFFFPNLTRSIILVVLFLFVAFRHKDNIKRLLKGEERESHY